MSRCQAPYRLPDGYYDKFEDMEPEETAFTVIVEVLANDHDCGDPAVATRPRGDRMISVCAYHRDWYDQTIGMVN